MIVKSKFLKVYRHNHYCLKCKSVDCKTDGHKEVRISYSSKLRVPNIKQRTKFKKFLEEYGDWLFGQANEEHLDMEELHKLAELKEYKVTSERQKELSKELINKEYTVDELLI